MLSSTRCIAGRSRPPQASVTTTGISPRSTACQMVGAIPISRATPTMAKARIPRSRSAICIGVPAKADMASLSKMASSARGDRSATIWKPGVSRRNHDWTFPGSSTCCQAIAAIKELRRAHEPGRQGHVPGVENGIAAGPRRSQYARDPLDRLGTVRELAQHASLHVVHDEGHRGRIAHVLHRHRDIQAVSSAHQSPPGPVDQTPALSLAWAVSTAKLRSPLVAS